MPALANVYRFGIIDYLKKEVPTLSSSDIEFFSLIVLGASPSAISRACGYDHPATMYNKRLKLRKKLNIPSSETDLEEYILTTAALLKKKHDEGLDSLNRIYHV